MLFRNRKGARCGLTPMGLSLSLPRRHLTCMICHIPTPCFNSLAFLVDAKYLLLAWNHRWGQHQVSPFAQHAAALRRIGSRRGNGAGSVTHRIKCLPCMTASAPRTTICDCHSLPFTELLIRPLPNWWETGGAFVDPV
ncbi:hypothetical protein BKA82DRAFT_712832 [Pisolithus tinctorius]|uniref:Uncharacterized protein n=1 Tax=Pisolithus tinctorius Marx 270 TaxID=870435 RepID=A0A0C3P499_PISTI|nr:hypothetical protein BKA82DRAFT_712832 [Pisolithus tinctorius]KIO02109.1 hypothetical protein M404DRAFT_712832 [Pisolithus tinctorius Marx 270]